MVKHRSVWLFWLLLFMIAPRFVQSVEWRLGFSPFFGLSPQAAENKYSSSTWEAYNEARGYVYVTLMESNDTGYKVAPSLVGGEVSLTGWLTHTWGISLSAGFSPFFQSVQNQYKLDYLWYDGETAQRYSYSDQRSRLTRLWADLALNRRFYMGNRTGLVVRAGLGLHHLSGQVTHEYGWAATTIADSYHVDYFLLPLNAAFEHTFLTGQAGLTIEYRLSRVITGQIGVTGWLAKEIHVPYQLDENRVYRGLEGHLLLSNPVDLLSDDIRGTYTINPSALRFQAGFSFWL